MPAASGIIKAGIATLIERLSNAEGDRTDIAVDKTGRQITVAGAVPERFVRGFTVSMAVTIDTLCIAAPAAGLRLYITDITLFNNHATVATEVEVKNDATAIYKLYAKALDSAKHYHFNTPLKLDVAEALNFKNVTTGAAVVASASGYIAP